MTDWNTYSIVDFIPYSYDTFYRFQESIGETVWPLQWLMVIGVLCGYFLVTKGRTRLCMSLNSLVWMWVGYSYFFVCYVEINWAGKYIGWIFVAEAALLFLFAIWSSGSRLGNGLAGVSEVLGKWIIVAGAMVYPIVTAILGGSIYMAETFGVHPTPTAITTLGFILLTLTGLRRWLVAVIPVIWFLLSVTERIAFSLMFNQFEQF